jgi:hypothetical protein
MELDQSLVIECPSVGRCTIRVISEAVLPPVEAPALLKSGKRLWVEPTATVDGSRIGVRHAGCPTADDKRLPHHERNGIMKVGAEPIDRMRAN